MTECPACALESEEGQDTCPYCGYEFPLVKKSMTWMVLVFSLLMIWPLLEVIDFLF